MAIGKVHNSYRLKGRDVEISRCPKCKSPADVELIFYSQKFKLGPLSGRESVTQVGAECKKCGTVYELTGPTLFDALRIYKRTVAGSSTMPEADTLLAKMREQLPKR